MPALMHFQGVEIQFGYGDIILGITEDDQSVALEMMPVETPRHPGTKMEESFEYHGPSFILSFPRYNNDSLQILIDKLNRIRDTNYPPNSDDALTEDEIK